MTANLPSDHCDFAYTLTWNEANLLRTLVSDHTRDAFAQHLLAKAEGHQLQGTQDRLDRARQLDAKVTALFLRLSTVAGSPATDDSELGPKEGTNG